MAAARKARTVTLLAVLAAATVSCSEERGGVEHAVAPVASGSVEPVGFDLAPATVETASGDVLELVLWVAESADQRQRGLTGVTDLGDAAGMLFVFGVEGDHRFNMSQTPMPLDIAFFDAGGGFVGSAAMEPCLDQPTSRCPRYTAEAPFQTAIEFPEGTLEELSISEGSHLTTPPR